MTSSPLRYWLLGLIACSIASLISIQWVDRPLALFFQPLRDTTAWYWSDDVLEVFSVVVALAVLFPIACGLWLVAGRRLAAWTQIPLTCSWSAILGLGAESLFKRIFGRLAPETFLRDGDYGFNFLHGLVVRDAFPSGTAIISLAIATVLWMTTPRLRTLATSLAAALCVAVIVLDQHWLADVLAGSYLGATLGWLTVLLKNPAAARDFEREREAFEASQVEPRN